MLNKILNHLPGDHPWQNLITWYDTIDSTNTRAKQLALSGAPHGTVLMADRQTGGRGRMGRSFHSPSGCGVYLSVILRPRCAPRELMHLTCATAVAARAAVEKATGLAPDIKWTNDLVCGRQKVAGILTELVTVGSETCAIVGIGINCCQKSGDFPEELRDIATSLAMVSGKEIDRSLVAACLIQELWAMDRDLLTEKSALMARYQAACITVGKDISLLLPGEVRHGHALGVDGDGALIVRFEDGSTEPVQSGEVSVRGMYGYL